MDRANTRWLPRLALGLSLLSCAAHGSASETLNVSGRGYTTDGVVSSADAGALTEALSEADALQYGHRFDDALNVLDQVLKQQPDHLQARLMQARIHLAQGALKQAQRSCQALLGEVSMTLSATCLLEVAGRMHPDRLANTYQQLSKLYQQQPASKDIRHWQQQILAEQAYALGHYDDVARWFAGRDFNDHPVVNQKLLADAWLAAADPQRLLAAYPDCPQLGQLPEDSMLVRIAHASIDANNDRHCWQQLTAQRMQIRIARDEALHTADIAYYFAYVAIDPTQALHYAELNYNVAKEPADQELLERARSLQ